MISRRTLPLVCIVATFVLIYDNQKVIMAEEVYDFLLDGHPLHRVARQTKYTSRYDNFDVDKVLTSKRLLLSYVKCLLDEGPCTKEGRELRELVPDALETECAKCTETQKRHVGKAFSYLLQNHRDYWDKLVAKYDPDGNFRAKYGVDEDYDYNDLEEA